MRINEKIYYVDTGIAEIYLYDIKIRRLHNPEAGTFLRIIATRNNENSGGAHSVNILIRIADRNGNAARDLRVYEGPQYASINDGAVLANVEL